MGKKGWQQVARGPGQVVGGPGPWSEGGGGLRAVVGPTLASSWFAVGPCPSGPWSPPLLAAGGEGGRSPDTLPAATSKRNSRSAAAAWSRVFLPPPHASLGPPTTAWAEPTHQGGPTAITSPRGALLGYGRIDTLLPH